MKGTTGVLVGANTTLLGYFTIHDIQVAVDAISLASAFVVIVAALAIYWYRGWIERIVITPFFMASVLHVNYTFFLVALEPVELVEGLIQMLIRVGVALTAFYFVWNRRKPHGLKTKAKEERDTQKDQTSPITKHKQAAEVSQERGLRPVTAIRAVK